MFRRPGKGSVHCGETKHFRMVRPKKHLGQHFLRDENIARKIISSLSPSIVNVVEIGPGTGILSKYLLENPVLNPFFFEVDNESVNFLRQEYPAISGKLYEKDFLKANLSEIPAPFAIIGNFPYNISSQILFRAMESRNSIPELIGMFQKEVAERIASPPGSKKYGILSVLLKAWFDIEYLFTVNETVFYPPPKVKSAVIRLTRNSVQSLECNEDLFVVTVKTAFNQRRKTLRNALKGMIPTGGEPSQAVLELFTKRAEQLSVAEFVELTRFLDV
jgi:16S rRNA (adenine1518-N6/adenine1519-N6)-dimethyltransferase